MKKVIIIGAGISGLSAGINALLNGYDVSIYEKNSSCGGCCSGWEREGYYIDNCMHWLTGTNQHNDMFKLWKLLGAMDETSNLYQGEYFYKSHLGDKAVALYTDLEKTRKEMTDLSIHNKKEIDDFIDAVKYCSYTNQKFNLLDSIKNYTNGYIIPFYKYHNMSLAELANRFTNPLLQKVFIDYLPSDYSALALIFAYATFVSGNGKVYSEGSKKFSENILSRYKSLNGKIFFNSEVKKINVLDLESTGITLKNDEVINGDIIICCCDLNFVFSNLLDNTYCPKELKTKLANTKDYPLFSSYHAAYLVKTKDDIIKDSEIIEIPSTVIGKETINRLLIKNYSYLYPTKENNVYQIFIPQNSDNYVYWKSLSTNYPKEYKEEKTRLANTFMNYIIDKYPELKDKISLLDTWTPATYNTYFNSYYGSYVAFTITTNSSFKQIPFEIEGLNNVYLCNIWQSFIGGLPIAAKLGFQVNKKF